MFHASRVAQRDFAVAYAVRAPPTTNACSEQGLNVNLVVASTLSNLFEHRLLYIKFHVELTAEHDILMYFFVLSVAPKTEPHIIITTPEYYVGSYA